jgi:hypothetical protein
MLPPSVLAHLRMQSPPGPMRHNIQARLDCLAIGKPDPSFLSPSLNLQEEHLIKIACDAVEHQYFIACCDLHAIGSCGQQRLGAEQCIPDNAHKLSVLWDVLLWGLVIAARAVIGKSCDALGLVGTKCTAATLVDKISHVEDGLPAAVDANGLGFIIDLLLRMCLS